MGLGHGYTCVATTMAAPTDTPQTTADAPPGPAVVPSGPRRWAALAGLVATACALGAAELLAGLVGRVPSLVVAVGNGVVELGAGSRVKQIAIALFGTNEKLALVIGTVVLSLLFGAVLGVMGRRWGLGAAVGGFVAFGGLGVLATTVNPLDDPVWGALAAVLAVLVGVGVLRWLLRVDAGVVRLANEEPGPGRRARREFLRLAAGLAAVAGAVGALGRSLSTRQQATAAREEVVLPTADVSAPTAAVDGFDGIDGITPLFTPNDDFYRIDTALTTPMVDVADWSLRIHGMVGQEVTLTYDDLLAMEQFEAVVTIACVSNEVGGDLIGNARWQGVRLSDVLDLAGVDPATADQLVGRSVDGWTAGFPTPVAYDGRNAMIALAMNGEPLPLEHGFPARLIVPGLYGYVSATKWLSDIELTTWEAFDGYWIPRGWAKEGPVKTQSRIDVPARGAQLRGGEQVIAGVAWAQHRGLERVEVQVDDGEWQEAELGEELNVDTWRQWRFTWAATPGEHVIRVRATDATGMTQGAERVPVAPDGAEGHHTRSVRVI